MAERRSTSHALGPPEHDGPGDRHPGLPGRGGGIRLGSARPNPFRGGTRIADEFTEPGEVLLRVFDMEGRLVRVLEAGHAMAGSHETHWDGLDQWGRRLPSGVFFYRLDAGESSATRKVLVLR